MVPYLGLVLIECSRSIIIFSHKVDSDNSTHAKGQLIWHSPGGHIEEWCLGKFERSVDFETSYWCLQFFQKMNENNLTSGTIKSNVFVRFLGETKIPKKTFWNQLTFSTNRNLSCWLLWSCIYKWFFIRTRWNGCWVLFTMERDQVIFLSMMFKWEQKNR